MKRPFAVVCLFLAFAQIMFSVLPPVVLLLPAAFLVCLLCLKTKSNVKWLSCCVCIGLLLGGSYHVAVEAVTENKLAKFQEREVVLTAEVGTCSPGFDDECVNADLMIISVDDCPVRIKAYAQNLPASIQGEQIKGVFQLSVIPSDLQNVSFLSDGNRLKADYLRNIEWSGNGKRLGSRMFHLQKQFSSVLYANLDKPFSSIVSAMCIGDRSGLTAGIKKSFAKTGTSHLLVISGLHLSLICGVFLSVYAKGKRKRLYAGLAAFLCIFVMLITGLTPSVCRAGIMVLFLCFARIVLLPVDSFTSLAFAAALLCIVNPWAIFDIGYQLSFCATVGIMIGTRIGLRTEHSTLIAKFTALFMPSVFAAIATLPIQLINGLSISILGPFVNLIVGWMVAPIVVCGLISIVCSCIPGLQFVSQLLAISAGVFAKLLYGIVSWFSNLSIPVFHLPVSFTLFLIVLLSFQFFLLRNYSVIVKALSMTSAFLAFVMASWWLEKDVVSIHAFGSTTNPGYYLCEGSDISVIFRGGVKQYNQICEQLDEYYPNANVQWIDLSNSEGDILFPQNSILVDTFRFGESVVCKESDSVRITCASFGSGSAVFLDVGNWRGAVLSGNPILSQKPPVDVYLAGNTDPGCIRTERVVTYSDRHQWLDNFKPEHVTMLQMSDAINIRCNKAVDYPN